MKLNKLQKVALIVYASVVLASCIYVPFVACSGEGCLSIEYSLIWHPQLGRIDVARIVVELFAVSVLFGVLVVVTHKHS